MDRKHVSRAEMLKLEAGQVVELNSSQLAELRAYAPKWVRVTAVATSLGAKYYRVAIDDMRGKVE